MKLWLVSCPGCSLLWYVDIHMFMFHVHVRCSSAGWHRMLRSTTRTHTWTHTYVSVTVIVAIVCLSLLCIVSFVFIPKYKRRIVCVLMKTVGQAHVGKQLLWGSRLRSSYGEKWKKHDSMIQQHTALRRKVSPTLITTKKRDASNMHQHLSHCIQITGCGCWGK